MSSSTMMNGPSMPRASQVLRRNEAVTMPASQAHAGTARTRSPTSIDLGDPGCDLLGLG